MGILKVDFVVWLPDCRYLKYRLWVDGAGICGMQKNRPCGYIRPQQGLVFLKKCEPSEN